MSKYICEKVKTCYEMTMAKKSQFSIRLPDFVIENLKQIASEIGFDTKLNNVVESACEWYCNAYKAHGYRPLTKSDMDDLMRYIRSRSLSALAIVAEDAGKSVPQDSPSPVVVRPENGGAGTASSSSYSKPKRRKSSG